MNLKQLIDKCKKRNIDAQKELYETYKSIIYNLSLKYCSCIEDAEDNLHDTFIIVFNNIEKYNDKGSFEGWLKRICINKAIDKYKNGFKTESLKDNFEFNLYEEEMEINEKLITSDIVLGYVQSLPNQYRIVFNLYELDGYSHKEISKMLNISENTSKSNLFRAKNILKHKILKTIIK